MEYLVAEYKRLEKNLMSAEEERNQIAIHRMMRRIAVEILNSPR